MKKALFEVVTRENYYLTKRVFYDDFTYSIDKSSSQYSWGLSSSGEVWCYNPNWATGSPLVRAVGEEYRKYLAKLITDRCVSDLP